MMSEVMLISRFAALIHAMRSRYHSRVYSRAIAFSTSLDPLCTGRCTWSQSVGTASSTSTMSFEKCLGCEVVNLTRRIPGTVPTASSNSANVIFPEGSSYEFTFCPSS